MKFHRSTGQQPAAEGQVLILFAMMSLVLIGFMALAVDVGYLLSERRQAQSAADAATLAAAASAVAGDPTSVVTSSGKAYGALNADVSDDNVEVHRPPISGDYAGEDDYIQVIVTKDVERFFLGAIYQGEWSVQASATAGIEPDPLNAAILALNGGSGGIDTSGSTEMVATGGSIFSNYNIETSGSTTITSDEMVAANDGFDESGASNLNEGGRSNPNAPEIPDPLADKIEPPPRPDFPDNPVPSVNPDDVSCGEWGEWSDDGSGPIPEGTYSGGGSSCVDVANVGSGGLTFSEGDYLFENNAAINVGGGNSGEIVIDGGAYVFDGGSGIDIGGDTPHFEMRAGEYAFLDGAGIEINGSAPNNILGAGSDDADDSYFYFSGGGGIDPGGSNQVTLNPGTYIFDDGPGIDFGGSSRLVFNSGEYEFWFADGAGLRFSGDSHIELNGDADEISVKMYFYGDRSNVASNCNGKRTQMCMSGSTDFNVPPGQYYFDRAAFINSGNSLVTGEDVFFYFTNGGFLHSSGSANFGFTAPEDQIYPGYYPGVFMYSDRDNTATFQWNGSTDSYSRGVLYLPSSPLVMSGASRNKVFEGQIIADRIETGGGNYTNVTYNEYAPAQIPQVYLVE